MRAAGRCGIRGEVTDEVIDELAGKVGEAIGAEREPSRTGELRSWRRPSVRRATRTGLKRSGSREDIRSF